MRGELSQFQFAKYMCGSAGHYSDISHPSACTLVGYSGVSGKDKGGPSKGGFLNNQLCSYTDLYLRNEIKNEINVVYKHNMSFMEIIDYSGNHLY